MLLSFLYILCRLTCSKFSVHERRLADEIPVEKLLVHDVPVDIICTPSELILTQTQITKPQEKLGQICILRELKNCIERETWQLLPCWPSEKLPPTPQHQRRR